MVNTSPCYDRAIFRASQFGAIMNSINRQGSSVPLAMTVPNDLVEWLDSAAGQQALSTAAESADRSIAALNSEREIRREDLHQPITL